MNRPVAGPRRGPGAGEACGCAVRVTVQPPRGCITLGGDIDLLVHDEVRAALSEVRGAGCTVVDVDAAQVIYVDCRVLGLLAKAQADLAGTGGRLRVVRASWSFRRVARVAGFDHLWAARCGGGR